MLLTFNILAFLFYAVLEMIDERYHIIRKELPTRKTFFDDIRALPRYRCVDSWDHVLGFMMEGLELEYTGYKLAHSRISWMRSAG